MKNNLVIKFIGISSLLVSITYVLGFLALFIINPDTFKELNNISLAAYNLNGMLGRLWAAWVIYILVGILNTLVCIFLLRKVKLRIQKIGVILFLIGGVCWLTFGLFPYDHSTNLGNSLMLSRVILMLVTTGTGLVIFSVDFDGLLKDALLKKFTLLSGFLIISLGFMSTFVYDDLTWIRSNLSFTTYFVWMGIFGLRYLRISVLQLSFLCYLERMVYYLDPWHVNSWV